MKKIISVFLSFVLVAVFLPKPTGRALEQNFSDVPPEHWAYKWVESAASRAYVSGTGDGKFTPSATVSNCAFVTMVIKATIGVQPAGSSHWAENYMQKAFSLGVASPLVMPESSWNKPISRQEMAAVIIRASDIIKQEPFLQNTDSFTAKIKDWSKIPDEYKPYIAQAYAKGIVGGKSTGEYDGSSTGTRAEACVMVFRLADSSYRSAEYSGIKFDKMGGILENGRMTAAKSEEFLMKTLGSLSFYSQNGEYFVKGKFSDLPEEFEYHLEVISEFKNGKAVHILSTEAWSIPSIGDFTGKIEGMAKISDLEKVTVSMSIIDTENSNASLYLTFSSNTPNEIRLFSDETSAITKKSYDFSKLFTWK